MVVQQEPLSGVARMCGNYGLVRFVSSHLQITSSFYVVTFLLLPLLANKCERCCLLPWCLPRVKLSVALHNLNAALCCAGPRWEGTEAKMKGLVRKLMVELGFLPFTHLTSVGLSLLPAQDEFWGRPGCGPPCWRNLAKTAKALGSSFCSRRLNFAHT